MITTLERRGFQQEGDEWLNTYKTFVQYIHMTYINIYI